MMRRVCVGASSRCSTTVAMKTVVAAWATASRLQSAAVAAVGSSSASANPTGGAAVVGMAVSAFTDTVDSDPIATGRITAKIGDNVFAVSFDRMSPSTPVLEVGSRVVVFIDPALAGPQALSGAGGPRGQNAASPAAATATAPGTAPGVTAVSPAAIQGNAKSGIIAKAQGNGTFAVLLDDNTYHATLSREQIITSEGRPKFTGTEKFARFLAWIQEAGVHRRSDAYSAACVLFQRGWRVDTTYLLEPPDVHCISHLNKSVRMSILDAAEAEKDKQRLVRDQKKEQIKERQWKYWIPKYASTFGTATAFFGASSVFTWNFLNWKKQKRPYQLELAVEALTTVPAPMKLMPSAAAGVASVSTPATTEPVGQTTAEGADGVAVGDGGEVEPHGVAVATTGTARDPTSSLTSAIVRKEATRLVNILKELDHAHPRILIVSGLPGSGKSTCTRLAADAMGFTGLSVEIRGKDKDDPVRAIVKALGVSNIELCGDLFEFVAEACKIAGERMGGRLPLIVLKLREGEMGHVYDDAVTLACDRHMCHIILEMDSDKIEKKYTSLPRTDYVHIHDFEPNEAMQYAGHSIDPVDLKDFFEQVSTNAMDIDELVSTVHRQPMDAREFILRRLNKTLSMMKAEPPEVQNALNLLANKPLTEGVHSLKALFTTAAPAHGRGSGGVAASASDAASIDKAIENLRAYCVYHSEKKAWIFKNRANFNCAAMLASSKQLQMFRAVGQFNVRDGDGGRLSWH